MHERHSRMANHTIECSQVRLEINRRLDAGEFIPALHLLNAILSSEVAELQDFVLAGQVLNRVGEYAQAEKSLRAGLALQPDHPESQYELATALFQLGRVSEAIPYFLEAAARTGSLLVLQTLATIVPGCLQCGQDEVLRVRREFARRLVASAAASNQDHGDSQLPDRAAGGPAGSDTAAIRVGYVSAFFHRANYMKPVWAVINGHDRDRFEVCLFADRCDETELAWFQPGPEDQVHLTGSIDNDALANLIREQSLDILIDLNGYSVPSRLGLWTTRLARVTAAWFNMYATSALPGLDWIIGDEHVIRPDEEAFYSERVARLPQSYLSFAVDHAAPDIVPPPCLQNGFVTFGSLVSQYKITPEVLDAWSTILERAKPSRLVLANRAMNAECNRDFLMAELTRRGVHPDRITLLPPADHFEFLKYYNRIDLALDAFPYNGGTTTTEALWQGVPVLCFDGDRWASRTSVSLLADSHLPEFIARDRQAWIDMAVRLATAADTGPSLAALRSSMRERLLASNVCQTGPMVRSMEQLFVHMLIESGASDQPLPGGLR